jgi:hypothetical protein
MKIGNMEGTREEIKGFIEDHGLNAADLIQLPAKEKEIGNKWVIIPCSLFILSSIVLSFINNSNIIYIPIVTVNIAMGGWGIVVVHLKYKNWIATSICIVIMSGIVGICSGILTLKEVLEYFRNKTSK